MRLWSIHPKYLDSKGLVALWREALLAKKVLQNRTKGYIHHPQLIRFREQISPLSTIDNYLNEIFKESKHRCFNFNVSKIGALKKVNRINVASDQLKYEFDHLLNKLKLRDKTRYKLIKNIKNIEPNPLFIKISGGIEKWENIRL